MTARIPRRRRRWAEQHAARQVPPLHAQRLDQRDRLLLARLVHNVDVAAVAHRADAQVDGARVDARLHETVPLLLRHGES